MLNRILKFYFVTEILTDQFLKAQDWNKMIKKNIAIIHIEILSKITFLTPLYFSLFLEQNDLCEKYSVNSKNDVKDKFIEAAKEIKYYQAVRHTMGKMRTGKTDFGTKLTAKSGKLPKKLDEEFCKNEAWIKIEEAKLLTTNSWTKDNFLKFYQNFIDIFNKNFMKELDFLIYFQGKDFASSLMSILANFPLKKYYKFAKEHNHILKRVRREKSLI